MVIERIKVTKKGNRRVTPFPTAGSPDQPVTFKVLVEYTPKEEHRLSTDADGVFARIVRQPDTDEYSIRWAKSSYRVSLGGVSASELLFPDYDTAIDWAIRLYFASVDEAKHLEPVWEVYGPPKVNAEEALRSHKISMIRNVRFFGYSLPQAKTMVEALARVNEDVPARAWADYDYESLRLKVR